MAYRCSRFLQGVCCRVCDEFVYSGEEVTQGDPLLMLVYAIAAMALRVLLRCKGKYLHHHADDLAYAGSYLTLILNGFVSLFS